MFALQIVSSTFLPNGTLFLYGMLFVWSSTGVGFVKGWFAMMQNHIVVMKELKRVQLMLVERQTD